MAAFLYFCREDLSQVSTDVEPQRPMFTQLLSPTKDVPEGARVRLDCVLVGHPEPEVQDCCFINFILC